jgi:predicted CXXCH cytochrome family protein
MRRLLQVLVPLAIFPWLFSWGAAVVAQQARAAAIGQQAVAKQSVKPAEYAGQETCALCHADLAKKFSTNPHSQLALMHSGKGVTCESCHGSGAAHVSSGGDPTKILQLSKMNAKQIDATCLGCHASAHPNFARSDHGKAGVSCMDCHSIHGYVAAAPVKLLSVAAGDPPASPAGQSATPANPPVVAMNADKKPLSSWKFLQGMKPDASGIDPLQRSATSLDAPGQNPNLLKASQPQLCFSCHSDVKPAFSQPFHHKVNEGLMKCTDCHDTHGTFGNNQLRSTADQTMVCTKCHTETRGPFVFEHAAVKSEGCLGCHSPHGSQNARLLNVPNINQMCNQCHSPVAMGTVHGIGAGSAEVLSCVNCHTKIHGSNVNPALIR